MSDEIRRICMIGGRDLTQQPEGTALFRHAAVHMAREGYRVVTLPTAGACQLAAEAALVVGGTVELLVPDPRFQDAWVTRVKPAHGDRVVMHLFDPEIDAAWVEADHVLHPEHKRLGGPDVPFFACIYGAIQMSGAVIALPWTEEMGVEVAPAIRVARALGKPLLVLTNEKDREQLRGMLG